MSQIYAGFHRSDMTPKTGGIPLAGWGSTQLRLAANVVDPIYCHALAVGSSEKPELIIINFDLIDANPRAMKTWRPAISEALGGLPEERIIISGTHTHEAPDMWSSLDSIKKEYIPYTTEVLIDASRRAVADMKPAKVFYGKTEVGRPGQRLSFVRHYTMKNIQDPTDDTVYMSGNNFGFQYLAEPEKYVYTGHESEADPEMQLMELRRENADDILLVNWQCHALLRGGVFSDEMTSDFCGPLRDNLMEMLPNTQVVYVQGACGNINPGTRIKEEALLGLNYDPFRPNDDSDSDHRAYGKILAAYAKDIHDYHLVESKSDELKFTKKMMVGKCDHSRDDMAPKLADFMKRFAEEGNTREVIAAAMELGLNSPYHAAGIVSRSKLPETELLELNAVSFGDVAMVTSPCEMYDQIGRFVKKNSPFPATLIQGYSCGSFSYIPAEGTTMDSYERNATRYVPGTAEQMEREFIEMLNELK